VPRCFEAVEATDTSAWHLLLEDLTDTHFIATAWPLPPTLEQWHKRASMPLGGWAYRWRAGDAFALVAGRSVSPVSSDRRWTTEAGDWNKVICSDLVRTVQDRGRTSMQPISTDRRDFIKSAAVIAVATAASSMGVRGADAQEVPYSTGTEPPKLKAPANACDCHMHIYDAKYPVAPSATLKPADALVADYKLLQKRIGTSRNVIVTPSTYGTDNRVTLDAIGQIGATARGVAVVDASVTDAELKRMNDLGIRGIRFNLVQAGATTVEMIEPLSKRVNDLGWHIQFNMKGEQIAAIEDLLLRVSSPMVFDHLGRLAQPNALDNPGFKTISKLIDKGNTWVKLSGAYQDSKVGPPSYSDTVPVARAYIKAAPQRMVWASDWPHPTEKEKPNDAVLLDLLAEWAPDPGTRTAILVQNPLTLYGFPTST
jgi:predicted TIM-barrel fold metal-dependent hydrolase